MSIFNRSKYALAIAGAVIGSGMAHAATLSSDAYAARATVGALNLVSADAVVGQTSGSTPGAYNNTGTLASVNQSTNIGVSGLATLSDRITAGIADERASSNGTTTATGTITLAAPTVALNSTITLPIIGTTTTTLLGLSADAITSTSTVTNMGGVLTATGLSSIANLQFNGALAPLASIVALLGGTLNGSAAANSTFSLLGNTVVLTLNEQIRSSAADMLGIETNALHLSLNGYQLLGGGVLSGDFVLGHSAASISGAVPEPASSAMMIAGFGLVGAALRGTRRQPRTMLA